MMGPSLSQIKSLVDRLGEGMMLSELGNRVLSPPCIWCGYNGDGFWRGDTHDPECFVYGARGLQRRVDLLMSQLRRIR